MDDPIDPSDPEEWQALCGRHQVMKNNYWDHTTGWLNVYAIVQAGVNPSDSTVQGAKMSTL
jgi:hypothetical protein